MKSFVKVALGAALSRIRRLVQLQLSQAARKRKPALQGAVGGEDVAGSHDESLCLGRFGFDEDGL